MASNFNYVNERRCKIETWLNLSSAKLQFKRPGIFNGPTNIFLKTIRNKR